MKLALVSLPKNEFRYPPIGLLRIATFLRNNIANLEIKLIDNTFEDIYLELDNFSPDIIGLTTFTSYYQDAVDFAKKIKQKKPELKIIIGGPHITTLPESLDRAFDFGVMGEGEQTIFELVNSITQNKKTDKIPGIIYHENNKIRINKKRELSNIDEFHKIDYSFINKNYFKKKFIPEICGFGVSFGIMTSIGCPYNCRFCSIKVCWDKIRFRKLDYVVEEIKELYNYGVRHIDFYDDLFSINKTRLKELREKLKQEGLLSKMTFSCQARTNLIDDEMCQILKSINIKTITFGFESGSDKVLKYIKNDNNLSIEDNKRAIALCRKYRINAFGCLMMGMPGETLEDMDKTIEFIDFAIKNKALRIWTQILVPLPETEMWEIAVKRKKIDSSRNNWRNIHIHNKENAILLDSNIPYEKFLEKYALAKKKCRFFVYRLIFKTIKNNPLNIIYFAKESMYYLKRFFSFMKQ